MRWDPCVLHGVCQGTVREEEGRLPTSPQVFGARHWYATLRWFETQGVNEAIQSLLVQMGLAGDAHTASRTSDFREGMLGA